MTMKCSNPKCNFDLPDGARFCTECGTTVKTEAACRFCGVMNPMSAAFCLDCGKPQTEQAGKAGSMATMPPANEFIYLLDQEKLRSESAKDVVVPYGCVAVSVVNGQVQKVHYQKAYTGNKDNTYKGWLTSIWEAALGVAGQKEQEVKTYVLMDLRRLPVITYSHPVPVPGLQEANLRFELWVDTDNIKSVGLFLQRCLGTRRSLSFSELKAVAVENITQLVGNFNLVSLASDPASASLIGADLERITGISSLCYFAKGKLGLRKHIEISKVQAKVKCPECPTEYATFMKFCEDCGANLSKVDWTAGASYLLAAGGEQLTLRLSMLVDQSQENKQVNIDDAKVSEEVIKYLGPILRRYDVPSLMKSVMLSQLSNELNTRLMRDWRGFVTEFTVVDLRTAEEEWFFKTDALVAEELRKVESEKKFLAVEGSELDLAEMAFALTMREVRQQDTEELMLRRQALEARSKIADVEVNQHALETQTDLRKEGVDDEAHKQRLARDKDKMLRERDVAREMTSGKREDDLTQLDHDITLDKKAAQHDIDLGDMTGEAQSRAVRRGISDESFVVDEEIRLEAKRKEQLGNIEEDLEDRKKNRRVEEIGQLGNIQEDLDDRKEKRQIDKLRAMAELEASMTAQENAQELNKIDAMKSMGAAEMLAMQAADLAKNGASADMIRGITDASSGVKIAEAKEAATRELLAMQKEMMQLMMAQQSQSSVREAEALKLAVNVAQSTNEKSMESMMQVAKVSAAESNQGYKEAAKISQSVNEKSMDSMAKVATAAAGKKTTGKDDSDNVKFECKSCGAVDSKIPKFCGSCGAKPTDD
jgi:hypothetical protein